MEAKHISNTKISILICAVVQVANANSHCNFGNIARHLRFTFIKINWLASNITLGLYHSGDSTVYGATFIVCENTNELGWIEKKGVSL